MSPPLFIEQQGALLNAESVRSELLAILNEIQSSSITISNVSLIATLHWNAVNEPLPLTINTAGYSAFGKGAATYYRQNGTGPGAYTPTRYRFMDGDGFWWALDPNLHVTPEQLGAMGDATISGTTVLGTDDTAAFLAGMDGYFKAMRMNPTGYQTGNFSQPPGHCLYGYAGFGYVTDESQVRPVLIRKPGSTAVVDYGAGQRSCTLIGFLIDCVANDCIGISGGSSHANIRDVQVLNASVGIGGSTTGSIYTRSLKATNVNVETCTTGMQNFIDSEFINCAISNCGTGFHGTAGANSNNWTGGRMEFSTSGHLIDINTSSDYLFSNFMLDRSFLCGVYLQGCADMTFTGIKYRRSGAADNGNLIADAHLFLDNCSRCQFISGDATKGSGDGSVPPTTPKYFAKFNNVNDHITINGVDVSNSNTVGLIVYNSGLSTTQMPSYRISACNGIDDFDNVSLIQIGGGRRGYGVSPAFGTIPALGASPVLNNGQNQAFVFTLAPITTFDTRCYTLLVFTRDATAPGSRQQAKFPIIVRAEAGAAVIEADPVYSQTSSGIAFSGATTIGLAFSGLASDGSSVTLTATNANAHQIRVWVQMVDAP